MRQVRTCWASVTADMLPELYDMPNTLLASLCLLLTTASGGCAEAKRHRGHEDMRSGFLHGRAASFAQRKATEQLSKARVVRLACAALSCMHPCMLCDTQVYLAIVTTIIFARMP